MISSFILLFFPMIAHASDPKEILEEAIAKQQVENSIQTLTMVLISKNGSTQERTMEIHIRKDDDALRSYTHFIDPPEIAGTQLLFVDHPHKDDPQLLYLPALKRVQRISGSKKNGSFLGSDFRFSDLELSLNDKETHTLLSEDDKNWVIQSIDPKDKQYSSWQTTISKRDHLPYTIEYYAKNGSLAKTFSIEETMILDDRLIPKVTQMTNHKKGSKTRLTIEKIEINLSEDKLPLERFTPQNLRAND
jgi:hypothetical protein